MDDEQTIREQIGGRLRQLREAGGFARLEDFAPRVGVDAPRLSRMERGERNISTLVLRRAAQVLEVSMDEFFESPTASVALMRAADDADGSPVAEMLGWAVAMQRDLRAIRDYDGAAAA